MTDGASNSPGTFRGMSEGEILEHLESNPNNTGSFAAALAWLIRSRTTQGEDIRQLRSDVEALQNWQSLQAQRDSNAANNAIALTQQMQKVQIGLNEASARLTLLKPEIAGLVQSTNRARFYLVAAFSALVPLADRIITWVLTHTHFH